MRHRAVARKEFGQDIEHFLEAFCTVLERHGQGFEFVGRPVGPATNENLDRYRKAGFHNLVLPWESIHPSGQADMSLSAKLRSMERVAKTLGLKP